MTDQATKLADEGCAKNTEPPQGCSCRPHNPDAPVPCPRHHALMHCKAAAYDRMVAALRSQPVMPSREAVDAIQRVYDDLCVRFHSDKEMDSNFLNLAFALKALSSPSHEEPVAWQKRPKFGGIRVWTGVPSGDDDLPEFWRRNNYEIRPLYTSPPNSGERLTSREDVFDIGGENSSWHGRGRIEVRQRTVGEAWTWRYITDDERDYLKDCLNNRIAMGLKPGDHVRGAPMSTGSVVNEPSIANASPPVQCREALEAIAAWGITPDTGFSVAQAMRRMAEDVLALLSQPAKE